MDPARYDYRRAVRDAIHFPALFDRFWQTPGGVSAGTCSTSAPSSHKNGALRISTPPFVAIPRAELRQIIAATYHQVWWHPCQVTLGCTEEAGRHIGYHKYLSKSIGQAAGLDEHAPDAQRDHAHRLHAELQITPCSPRSPVWLLCGIHPKGARHSMTPGRCKGKAHQLQHLGIAGRRVSVSRKWSNKTLIAKIGVTLSVFMIFDTRAPPAVRPRRRSSDDQGLVGAQLDRRDQRDLCRRAPGSTTRCGRPAQPPVRLG